MTPVMRSSAAFPEFGEYGAFITGVVLENFLRDVMWILDLEGVDGKLHTSPQ